MSLPQLKNMVLVRRSGRDRSCRRMPAFYQQPRTLDDLGDFMAGKIPSVLGIPHALYPRMDRRGPGCAAGDAPMNPAIPLPALTVTRPRSPG